MRGVSGIHQGNSIRCSEALNSGEEPQALCRLLIIFCSVALFALGIYLSYKATQAHAGLLRLSGCDEESITERLWKPHNEITGQRMYNLCVDLRGFYLKACLLIIVLVFEIRTCRAVSLWERELISSHKRSVNTCRNFTIRSVTSFGLQILESIFRCLRCRDLRSRSY